MAFYCLSIVRNGVRNDGLTKPKADINKLLEKQGFSIMRQNIYNNRMQKLFSAFRDVGKIMNQLEKDDVFIVNYPTDMGGVFDHLLLDKLKEKNVRAIAIVHDIDALRFKVPVYKNLKHEIKILNKYSCVIVPNAVMKAKLLKKGLNTKTVVLGLFDYLTNRNVLKKKIKYSNMVSFTGNLNKANFVNDLHNDSQVSYALYGPIEDTSNVPSELYEGSFDSEILIEKVTNGFGLIWDGKSSVAIDTSVISSGSYLLYNNPYKLSFYIAAGIPVVIWKRAAEGTFVRENGIGILVDSLSEVGKLIDGISEAEYIEMKNNVRKIQKRVITGWYINTAVKNALSLINNE